MRTSLRRTITRSTVAVTAVALAGSGALVAPAGASPASDRSAAWLTDQLDHGLVVSEYNDGTTWQQYTDYGLTLDVFYAFQELGTRPAKRQAIVNAIEPQSSEYTDAFGTRYAGALGKLLTAVELAGQDPTTYGDDAGRNLVADLEGLVVRSGAETGRAKDDPSGSDTSNTFGQSYVATALVGASSSLGDDATRFLLKQQCGAGFFREGMDSADFTCDGGTKEQRKPSVDATATVAIALKKLGRELDGTLQRRVERARADAIAWLVSKQKANGAFIGNGVANTNSTGLAAYALHTAGKNVKAKKSARWVARFQVTKKLVADTAFKAADLGAVAYDAGAFKAGKNKGITRGARYEWRRATAQAAPSLDLIG